MHDCPNSILVSPKLLILNSGEQNCAPFCIAIILVSVHKTFYFAILI